MTKLFLELEFQLKGNKQTKKGLIHRYCQQTVAVFLAGMDSENKIILKCDTEKDKNKNWTDLSL